jgi:O-antigen/teichoic acid export membrane protein
VAFGVRWGAIDQGVQFGIRIAATIALARLLTPQDLGIMAVATIVLSLGSLAIGIGVSDALVQRRDLDAQYVRVAFTISTVTSLLATAATIAVSEPLADLFNEPRLAGVLVATSVIFLLSGFERTPNDLLVREMRFRDFYLSSTIGTALAAVVGVAIAAAGGGVWALAAMAITESAAATLLAWAFALQRGIWHPAWGWDRQRARSLTGFGVYVASTRVLGYARANADNFAVAKVLGASSLGFYSLAYRAIITPITKVATIIGATAFSVFSSLQHDIPRIHAGLARANAYVALVCFPATMGVAVTAPLLVPVVFGGKWTPAVVTIQILAGLGPYFSFTVLDGPVFQAVGKPRLQFYVAIVQLAIAIPAIVVGVHHGINGVALSVLIASYATLPLVLVMRARLLRTRIIDQIRPVVPVAIATLFMGGIALATRFWCEDRMPQWAALLVVVLVGLTAYAAGLWLVARKLAYQLVHDLRRSV